MPEQTAAGEPAAPLSPRRPIANGAGGSGRLLANTVWNLLGQGLPLLAALVAIPLLIEGLGVDRFGILTLAWMVIGYFSLFDLGIGRALTKLVAERLALEDHDEIGELAWTALVLMALLGIAGAVFLGSIAPLVVHDLLKVPPALHDETLRSFQLLALSVPLVVMTTGLRGILEAYQRFDWVNAIRIPLGLLTFAAPLPVLPFTSRLDVVVMILLIVRLLAWFAHLRLVRRLLPELFRGSSPSRRRVRELVYFGGWMTVTNIIGPLMVYMDRFVIGSVISVSAVAYYVTPYEIVTKILIIPGALATTMFPAFSSMLATDRRYAASLFAQAVKYTLAGLFPIILVVVAFSYEGMRWWLDAQFAQAGSPILQWLALGVLFNGLAHIPFSFIQGAGRPDLTAKIHMVELPLYLTALFYCIAQWGALGAAFAWAGRAGIDALLLFALCRRQVPELRAVHGDALALAACLVALALPASMPELTARAIYVAAVIPAFGAAGWFFYLSGGERAAIGGALLRRIGAVRP